jgi:hypothetical protein
VLRLIACSIVVLAGAAQPALAQDDSRREPVLSRVVQSTSFTLKLPVESCTVADLTMFLLKHLEVPGGVEMLPGPCVRRPVPVAEEIPLLGLTLKEALDLLVKADSRFYWVEADGVVVMRPLEAWNRKDHFLHAPTAGLTLKDANIGAVMDALFPERGGNRGLRHQTMAADPSQITIDLGVSSIVEALDAVTRVHGRARWHVTYCLPEMQADVATVWLFTYADQGIGVRGAYPVADGKWLNRCRPQ